MREWKGFPVLGWPTVSVCLGLRDFPFPGTFNTQTRTVSRQSRTTCLLLMMPHYQNQLAGACLPSQELPTLMHLYIQLLSSPISWSGGSFLRWHPFVPHFCPVTYDSPSQIAWSASLWEAIMAYLFPRFRKWEGVRIIRKDTRIEAVSLRLPKGRHGARYLCTPDETLLLFLSGHLQNLSRSHLPICFLSSPAFPPVKIKWDKMPKPILTLHLWRTW